MLRCWVSFGSGCEVCFCSVVLTRRLLRERFFRVIRRTQEIVGLVAAWVVINDCIILLIPLFLSWSVSVGLVF